MQIAGKCSTDEAVQTFNFISYNIWTHDAVSLEDLISQIYLTNSPVGSYLQTVDLVSTIDFQASFG